jgi:hypothetical protein
MEALLGILFFYDNFFQFFIIENQDLDLDLVPNAMNTDPQH